ncbi:MAG: molybdenum cofactor biosynthesis protein B [Alphaproteobacteria bacterium]|nr:MAG: molybdenum cofactor biosynthesis protein B [Alphaproteobacteria bacterium]
MPGIDESRRFVPLGIAVLTVSDSRTLEDDRSGAVLVDRITTAGHRLADRRIVPDDETAIAAALSEWIADSEIAVILSTGGTGLTGRDITPEVFHRFYDKEIPGFGELFRMISYEIIGTSTIQSRATGGLARGTLLFALPGSPSACRDAWDRILADQLDYRFRPCNFVELMPRFREGAPA